MFFDEKYNENGADGLRGKYINECLGSGRKFIGTFEVQCWDADGNLKWEDINSNTVTNSGIDNILDVYFNSATQSTNWYVGLKGTGSAAAGDTIASHSGWSEITDYTGNRQAFVVNAAASQSISNSGNAASFSITGDATVDGAFLVNHASSNDAAYVLFCVEDFASSRSVANGDTLTVTYTITGADA